MTIHSIANKYRMNISLNQFWYIILVLSLVNCKVTKDKLIKHEEDSSDCRVSVNYGRYNNKVQIDSDQKVFNINGKLLEVLNLIYCGEVKSQNNTCKISLDYNLSSNESFNNDLYSSLLNVSSNCNDTSLIISEITSFLKGKDAIRIKTFQQKVEKWKFEVVDTVLLYKTGHAYNHFLVANLNEAIYKHKDIARWYYKAGYINLINEHKLVYLPFVVANLYLKQNNKEYSFAQQDSGESILEIDFSNQEHFKCMGNEFQNENTFYIPTLCDSMNYVIYMKPNIPIVFDSIKQYFLDSFGIQTTHIGFDRRKIMWLQYSAN